VDNSAYIVAAHWVHTQVEDAICTGKTWHIAILSTIIAERVKVIDQGIRDFSHGLSRRRTLPEAAPVGRI
jgi:hypothetical protein